MTTKTIQTTYRFVQEGDVLLTSRALEGETVAVIVPSWPDSSSVDITLKSGEKVTRKATSKVFVSRITPW